MKTITASVVCYLISKEITGRGFGLLPMADDHSTTSVIINSCVNFKMIKYYYFTMSSELLLLIQYPNEVDDKLYWKCFYCLYENPADSMLCSICKRYPSDKTEYLTLSEWSQKNYSQSPSVSINYF